MQSFLANIVASPSRDNLAVPNSTNSMPHAPATAVAKASVITNPHHNLTYPLESTMITGSTSVGSVWSGRSDSSVPNDLNIRSTSRVIVVANREDSVQTIPPAGLHAPTVVSQPPQGIVKKPPPLPKDAFATTEEDDTSDPTSLEPDDDCFDSPTVQTSNPAPAPPVLPPAFQMTSFLQPLAMTTHPHQREVLMATYKPRNVSGESMMSFPNRLGKSQVGQSLSRFDTTSDVAVHSPLMSLLSFTVSTECNAASAAERREVPTVPKQAGTPFYIKPNKLGQSRLDSQPLAIINHPPAKSILGHHVAQMDFLGRALDQSQRPAPHTAASFAPLHQPGSTVPPPVKKTDYRRLSCGMLPESPSVALLTTLVPYTWLEPPMQVVSQRKGKGLELTPSLAEEWTSTIMAGGLQQLHQKQQLQ